VSLIWDVLYLFGLFLVFPVLLFRMLVHGKYRSRLLERFGAVPRRRGDRACLWVHGVSVGELLASRTIVAAFRRRHPDWDVVISTTTDTGYAAALTTFADCHVITFPLDFTGAITRSLSRVRPSLVVLMELELWPNFVRLCARRRVPVVIANGRLSERGHRLQKMLGFVLSGSYRGIARVCVQTEEYARRFADVGAPPGRIVVTGSLKYDAVPDEVPGVDGLRRDLGIAEDEKLIVAGSTFAGEEDILLDVYSRLKGDHPTVRLAVVPRHPERFDTVCSLIRRRGFRVLRRSGGKPSGSGADVVILGDTMGELVCFYAAASVVFVGKSLVRPGGGQNLIEPAALGRAVVFGPYVANFSETRDLLLARDAAVQVADANELATAMGRLLADEKASADMGERAAAVIRTARGATDRTVDILEQVLASAPGSV